MKTGTCFWNVLRLSGERRLEILAWAAKIYWALSGMLFILIQGLETFPKIGRIQTVSFIA
jgi:hypothetical protein